ncbi:MAG: hypothetical protein ACTTJ2_00170 [Anaerovoracaceae bacterium]
MPKLDQVTEYLSEDFSDTDENDMTISESEPDSDSTPSDRRSRRRRRIAAQIEQENMESEEEKQQAELHDAIRAARMEAEEEQAKAQELTAAEAAAFAALETAEEEAAAAALIKDDDDILPPNVLSKDCKVSRLIGSKRYFDSLIISPFKPTLTEESEFLMKITENFDWKINTGGSFYVNSGSTAFNKEFEKVMLSYVRMERGEFPILIYDSTVRCSGRYGFVLTDRYFHFHTRELIPYKFKLSRIRNFVVDFGDTSEDWSILRMRQLGSRVLVPVFKSINAERVIEVADVLMRMIYHMLSKPRLTFTVNGIMPYKLPEPETRDGFFGLLDLILNRIFRKKPDFDLPGRPYTSDFHIVKLNNARVAAGLDPVSKHAPEKENGEVSAENADSGDDSDKKDKKDKKNKKNKKSENSDKGKDKNNKDDSDKESKKSKDKKKKGKKK